MGKIKLKTHYHHKGEYSLTLKMGIGQHLMITTGQYDIEICIFALSAQEIMELGLEIAQLGRKAEEVATE